MDIFCKKLPICVALLALFASSASAADRDEGMRLRACRLMKYNQAVVRSASEWWLAAGVSREAVDRKLAAQIENVEYYCNASWGGRLTPDPYIAGDLVDRDIKADWWLVEEQAEAEGLEGTHAELTELTNELTTHFLHMRMNGCGNLIGSSAGSELNSYLLGENAHGIDIFGNSISTVPSGDVLPVAMDSNSAFFDSRSVCKGSGSGGGGGGGKTAQPGSAIGTGTCYKESTISSCDDSPGPGIFGGFLSPHWGVSDGAAADNADGGDPEREAVPRHVFNSDTAELALETAVWIASAASTAGLAYTSIGVAAPVAIVIIGGVHLGIAGYRYYNKYYGDDRVNVGPRNLCPVFGDFVMPSAIAGGSLSGLDVFAHCSEVECEGVMGRTRQCIDTHTRMDCQFNPQVLNQWTCVKEMEVYNESTKAELHSEFCAVATCPSGEVGAGLGVSGCECSGGSQSNVTRPQLARDPCWYSYCQEDDRPLDRLLWRATRRAKPSFRKELFRLPYRNSGFLRF